MHQTKHKFHPKIICKLFDQTQISGDQFRITKEPVNYLKKKDETELLFIFFSRVGFNI